MPTKCPGSPAEKRLALCDGGSVTSATSEHEDHKDDDDDDDNGSESDVHGGASRDLRRWRAVSLTAGCRRPVLPSRVGVNVPSRRQEARLPQACVRAGAGGALIRLAWMVEGCPVMDVRSRNHVVVTGRVGAPVPDPAGRRHRGSEASNDLERASALRAERDWLITELTAAAGLGGRLRHFRDNETSPRRRGKGHPASPQPHRRGRPDDRSHPARHCAHRLTLLLPAGLRR